MTHVVTVEGPALLPIWTPFSDSPGTTAHGNFNGRVVHSADPWQTNKTDGVAELICDALRFSTGNLVTFSTWLEFVARPLRLYSTYRDRNPFLCFSTRLLYNFNTPSSIGTMALTNTTNSAVHFKLIGSASGITFVYNGTAFPIHSYLFNQLTDELSSQRFLSKKFDFFIAAKRIDREVHGLTAQYDTRAFIVVDGAANQIWNDTVNVKFKDTYSVEYRCSSSV